MSEFNRYNRPPQEEIRSLYTQEWLSTREIADRLGCSDTAVASALKEMGVRRRPRLRSHVTIKIPCEQWKLGYLAALIDGEGSISLRQKKTKDGGDSLVPGIVIANTSRELLEWVERNFGGTIYPRTKKKKEGGQYKDQFIWETSRARNLYLLLNELLPFLIVKKQKAMGALEICQKKLFG